MWRMTNPPSLEELRALLGSLDWESVRGEVDTESRARIALVGPGNAGKSTLFNLLKGWEASPASTKLGETTTPIEEDLGLFTLVDTPSLDGAGSAESASTTIASLEHAGLVLLVLDGAVGLRPSDHEWFSRLRAGGVPVIVVLNKIDLLGDGVGEVLEDLERQLATRVVPISARDGRGVTDLLVPQILDAYPELTVALGRELLAFRRQTATQVIRGAALSSALVGVEPVPLLDIPFQTLIQLRLVLRIAAIYGEPLRDRRGREVLAVAMGSALLRRLGQQVAKLVPVVGWAVSAALAMAGTWAIGRATIAYFENGRRLPFAPPRRLPAPGRWLGRRLARPLAAGKRAWQWLGGRLRWQQRMKALRCTDGADRYCRAPCPHRQARDSGDKVQASTLEPSAQPDTQGGEP